MKVSACVDCATTIIGDCLRCPSCHEQHKIAEQLGRHAKHSTARVVAWWLLFLQVLLVAVGLVILAVRSCL